MWYRTILSSGQQKGITKQNLNIPLSDTLVRILHELEQYGWRGLIVGGAVRDAVLGYVPKDIDIEVYGPDFAQLASVLKKHGHVLGGAADEGDGAVIGKAFGVIKFRDEEGNDYDFSLPRRDSKTGEGHTGFDIQVDPNMSPYEAARRRDFTFNCFAEETRILVEGGDFEIGSLCGQTWKVLNQNGKWVEAFIKSGGKQPLMRLILQRNGVKKEIFATPNHRWFIRNKHSGQYTSVRTTEQLKKGHFIPSVFPKNISSGVPLNNDAICRGFVFGDGSLTYGSRNIASVANFCGEKDKNMLQYFVTLPVGCPPKTYPGVIKIQGLPFDWKVNVPDLDSEDVSYLYGWLAGYFAADGCVDKKGCPTLCSASLENIEYVKLLCQKLGIGILHTNVTVGSGYKPDSARYVVSFVKSTLESAFFLIPEHRIRFENAGNKERIGWSVVSVESTERFEEVFCASVPIDNAFVLVDNVLTSNSMAYDPLSNEMHDYFGGQQDLQNKILRATDDQTFGEDPLRVLRGMQFAARMGLAIEPRTAQIAKSLADDLMDLFKTPENPNGISRERVSEEFMKFATKGKFPGTAIQYLIDTGWIKYFPQIAAIVDVPQEYEWHPEGWSSSIVPSDFFGASMTQSMPINLLTRDFIKSALAKSATSEVGNITRDTKAFVQNNRFVFNLASASSTRRCNFGFSPLIFPPTTVAPPKSFVRRRTILANGANKVIPVMFKIPLSRMDSIMQSSVDDLKVVNGIIESVAITMMNMLTGKQFSSQMNFHDVSVQEHTSADAGDRNLSIPANIMNPKFSVVNNDIVFNFELVVKGDIDTHNIEVPDKNESYLVNLGGVHTHTAHVMDAAAHIADRRGLKGDDRAVAIFAALGHDFAKAFTTEQREKGGKMRWTAHGHEEAGGPVVADFLKSIGVKNSIIGRVVPLVRKHLNHIQYKSPNINKGQVRGLSHSLSPATIEELVDLIEADHSGRPPLSKQLPEQAQWLLDAAKADGVHNRKPSPIITGKHVLPYFQGKTGPQVGQAVKDAYDAYLKGQYSTVEEGEIWLKNYIKSKAALLRGEHVLPYFEGKGGPEVGRILDTAWDAQLENQFADEESAQNWLSNYMQTRNQS